MIVPGVSPTRPLHFSDLNHMSRSPLHFISAANAPARAVTPAMRIGTAVDAMLLGGTVAPVYDGKRQGNAWKDFVVAHSDIDAEELLTSSEWDTANRAATHIRRHPLFEQYTEGAWFQRPIKWKIGDVHCATRGVDILSPRRLGDLKTTTNCTPWKLMRHCETMAYHAQLGWYDIALDLLEYEPRTEKPFLLCAEVVPPFDVVVLELDDETLAAGRLACRLWLETYRTCRDSNAWPGYAQTAIPWALRDAADRLVFDGEAEGDAT